MKSLAVKQFLALLLCGILLFTTACGGGGKTEDSSTEEPASTTDETSPASKEDEKEETVSDTPKEAIATREDAAEVAALGEKLGRYDETVTVSMVGYVFSNMNFKEGETFEDNLWTELYKDALNIEIDNLWVVNQEQYAEKMAASIAAKDLADIMNFGISDQNYPLLANNGMLHDMGPIYEEHASDFTKSIIEEDGGVSLESAKLGGTLWGVPNTNASIEAAQVLWIRQDWLDKATMELPTTLEETVELARHFQQADYDNVGQTWGITGNKDLGSFGGIFGMHGAYLNRWIDDGSGNLVFSSIQPEMKESLAFLNSLYEEGLLDVEFAVKSGDQMNEDVTSGRYGVYFGGHASAIHPLMSQKENNPETDWTPVPIPSHNGKPATQMTNIAASNYHVVTKDCEYPEALLKMLNLYTDVCFGEDPLPRYYITSEEYREPFILARVQTWPIDKNIQIANRIQRAVDSGDFTEVENHEETRQMYDFVLQYEETGLEGWDYTRIFGPNGSESVMNGYLENNQIFYDGFYGPPTDTMASKMSNLNTLTETTFTEMIMGATPIDDFDKYVEEWNNLGGANITAEVNEWKTSR